MLAKWFAQKRGMLKGSGRSARARAWNLMLEGFAEKFVDHFWHALKVTSWMSKRIFATFLSIVPHQVVIYFVATSIAGCDSK